MNVPKRLLILSIFLHLTTLISVMLIIFSPPSNKSDSIPSDLGMPQKPDPFTTKNPANHHPPSTKKRYFQKNQQRNCQQSPLDFLSLSFQEQEEFIVCSYRQNRTNQSLKYFLKYLKQETTLNTALIRKIIPMVEDITILEFILDRLISVNRKKRSDDTQVETLILQVRKLIAYYDGRSKLMEDDYTLYYPSALPPALIESIDQMIKKTISNLIGTWHFSPPSSPIEMIIYPTDLFSQVVMTNKQVLAFFDGRIHMREDLYFSPVILETTLRHEFVHYFLTNETLGKPLPTWFSEGISQYLECQNGCHRHLTRLTNTTFLPKHTFLKRLDFHRFSSGNELLYHQSLFLCLILTEIRKDSAIHPIKMIISGLSDLSSFSSDNILRSLSLSFDELYANAQQKW